MTQRSLLIIGCLLLLTLSGVNGYLGLHALSNVSGQQRAAALTQKQSAVGRIGTVEQRCELTALVLSLAVKTDRGAVAPLEASHTVCVAQLAAVKQLAAKTP